MLTETGAPSALARISSSAASTSSTVARRRSTAGGGEDRKEPIADSLVDANRVQRDVGVPLDPDGQQLVIGAGIV
jgi:hypothetical protein